MNIVSFNIPAVRDTATADAVLDVLRPIPGVTGTVTNVPARIVQVTYDESQTNPHALKEVIEQAGHRVQRYADGYR